MDNPCTSWLADAYWDNITELDKLTNFHGLMNSFEQYPRDWHLWYTNSSPEKAMLPGAGLPASASLKPVFPSFYPPHPCTNAAPEDSPPFRFLPDSTLRASVLSSPGEWENACNEMQRMLIVRSLRQDRVAFCVTSFIVSNLGSRFIEPPVLNMKAVRGSAFLPTQPSCPCLSTPCRSFPPLCPDTTPVLPGDGGLYSTVPTSIHPVPRCGPHQRSASAGRAHRHGPSLPCPVPGPGPGPHCCSAPSRGCESRLVSLLVRSLLL